MTTRDHFRAVMAQRRPYRNDPRYHIEWQYLTRACRKIYWLVRGVPVSEWRE